MSKRIKLFTLAALLVLALPGGVWAQAAMQVDDSGLAHAALAPADDFGYIFDDTLGISWVDASAGNQVVFNNPDDAYSQAIDIGFSFPFYEHTYSQLYVSTNGLVTFGEGSASNLAQRIPQDTLPNDYLAVLWDDLDVASGKVFTRLFDGQGFFAVTWEDVVRRGTNDMLTFQILLYKNGNIVFQYQKANPSQESMAVGIEDGDGVNGVEYLYHTAGLSNNLAVRFVRPDPAPRVKVLPSYQSGFALERQAGYLLTVNNTGDKGSDTYDLTTASSNAAWQVELFTENGVTPLGDGNQNGIPDTGALSEGGSATVTVKLSAPAAANVGDFSVVTFTAASTQDPNKKMIATIQSAIPAAFAQAYTMGSNNGMLLNRVWEHNSLDLQVARFYTGNTLSLGETSRGYYVYSWEHFGSRQDPGGSAIYSNVEFVMLDQLGTEVKSLTQLTDSSSLATADILVTTSFPSAVGAPDDTIGMVWGQYRLDSSLNKANANIYFAILDGDGNLVFGPADLTNDTSWYAETDPEYRTYIYPSISATTDNRYVISWIEERSQQAVSYMNYTVYASTGQQMKVPTALTQSAAGKVFTFSSQASLVGSRVLVAYSSSERGSDTSIYTVEYGVVNSQGDIVQAVATLAGANGWKVRALQLGDGSILMAWTDTKADSLAYAILDGDNYAVTSAPQDLPAVGTRRPDNISLTVDLTGRGVLTWLDADWNDFMYYALVDTDGSILTPPMIYLDGRPQGALVLTSSFGLGSASYGGAWQTLMPVIIR